MGQDDDSSPFLFERRVFYRLWLLIGGATFTLLSFIWLWFNWSRISLLYIDGTAFFVLFYFAARLAWTSERKARLAAESKLAEATKKPAHTPAEQHDYDTVKNALALVKDKGKTALIFLRRRGSLTFHVMGNSGLNPVPPSGLTEHDLLWTYRHCASEGILNLQRNRSANEETFTVSPNMTKPLDELLFTA